MSDTFEDLGVSIAEIGRARERRGRPTTAHERLVSKIRESCGQIAQETVDTTGVVTGFDGGGLLVHWDDERAPRQIGVGKMGGRRYQVGDRVIRGRTHTGREYVRGVYSTRQGNDPAIDSADLYDGAIEERHVKNGAVTTNKVLDESITPAKLDRSYAPSAHTHNYAQVNHNHNDLYYTDSESDARFAPFSHTHNYAAANHNHNSDYYRKCDGNNDRFGGDCSFSGHDVSDNFVQLGPYKDAIGGIRSRLCKLEAKANIHVGACD